MLIQIDASLRPFGLMIPSSRPSFVTQNAAVAPLSPVSDGAETSLYELIAEA